MTNKQKQELLDLLWDSLKTSNFSKDKKQTGWGTKTADGLLACIDRILTQ
jgi:hypothetical protein